MLMLPDMQMRVFVPPWHPEIGLHDENGSRDVLNKRRISGIACHFLTVASVSIYNYVGFLIKSTCISWWTVLVCYTFVSSMYMP